jgi:hypothetical protein
MGCRCWDIARCQAELNSLTGSISSNINRANTCSAQVSQVLPTIAGSIGQAVATDAMHEVEARLINLNKHAHELSQRLPGECGGEIQRLSALLSRMRSEDRAYHEARAAAVRAAAARARAEANAASSNSRRW